LSPFLLAGKFKSLIFSRFLSLWL